MSYVACHVCGGTIRIEKPYHDTRTRFDVCKWCLRDDADKAGLVIVTKADILKEEEQCAKPTALPEAKGS